MKPLESAIADFSQTLEQATVQLPLVKNPSNGNWSPKQILGHLIDSAANNHQRFVRGQLSRDLTSLGYEQQLWVATERFQDREWLDLIVFWLAYNRHLLHVMSHVPAQLLDASIRIDNDAPVTLEFVMIDYVRHLKHHLKQIGVAIE